MQKAPKQYADFELPAKSEFLILKEDHYFELLFNNFKGYLLNSIKEIY